jgi:hypothetical protein
MKKTKTGMANPQALKDKKKDSDTIENRLANSKFSLEYDYDYDSLPSNKELEDSGLSLQEYLDKYLRKGKPRKKPTFAGKGKTAEEIMAEDKPRGMMYGGSPKKMKKGGKISSRGAGCEIRG